MHPKIQIMLKSLSLEEKEQARRYRLDEEHSLKQLKAEGLAIHPIIVTRKTFGYADYPELRFKLAFPPEATLFRDGTAIECFLAGEEPVRGLLLSLDNQSGELRLFAPDFPDWIEDDGVGIKLAPDTRTISIMKTVLEELEKKKALFNLFQALHPEEKTYIVEQPPSPNAEIPSHRSLNESQQQAVQAILGNESLVILHGPPGTGKTTTLVEAIVEMVEKGEKILLSAPSNTAADHISKSLVARGIRLLRIGNTGKVDEALYDHTPEGKLAGSKQQKEIKQLKIRAEEFRRMALKYKRSFGKAEREQRNLLFREVRAIRDQIKRLQHYNEEKLFDEAQVIAGTPIGIYDAGLEGIRFHTLVIDEAGQCLEPLAWCIFPLAEQLVLAGDHWQLPPTVLSAEAAQMGLNQSILETAIHSQPRVYLLDTQYRMRQLIAGFSSRYFYKDLLKTAAHLENTGAHLVFIDTAGSGHQEGHGADGYSLQNPGELELALKYLETEKTDAHTMAIISPYSAQVTAARGLFPPDMRISTIDSFQGQEKEIIILSLVRSNDDGEIGFLKDYRRMNVAITRAKEKLVVIGDSATLASDPFFRSFLEYAEANGLYQSAWEYMTRLIAR